MVQKNTITTDLDQEASQLPESFQQKYMPIVATTAVVFIGIALTPLNPPTPIEGFVGDSTSTNVATITDESVNSAVPKTNAHLATDKALNFRLDVSTPQVLDSGTGSGSGSGSGSGTGTGTGTGSGSNTDINTNTNTNTNTKDSPLTPAKQRARLDSFRSSPLLWIIEIRHLHAERKNDITREELTVFRRTYPANPYERLLPTTLQVLTTD